MQLPGVAGELTELGHDTIFSGDVRVGYGPTAVLFLMLASLMVGCMLGALAEHALRIVRRPTGCGERRRPDPKQYHSEENTPEGDLYSGRSGMRCRAPRSEGLERGPGPRLRIVQTQSQTRYRFWTSHPRFEVYLGGPRGELGSFSVWQMSPAGPAEHMD